MKLRSLIVACLILAAGCANMKSVEPIFVLEGEAQYPVQSPDAKWIAFESRRQDGIDHIFVAGRDGCCVRQLTVGQHDDETPIFSPDGSYILFARLLGTGRNAQLDIFRIDIDGANIINLSNDMRGQDDHHRFSPDGKQIVFNSSRSTPFADLSDEEIENYAWNYDIWIMDADGSNQRPLVQLPGWDTYPSLSPSGEQILWRRVLEEEGVRNSEIFIADADGANYRNITNNPAFDGYPVYSPDGKWILFASNRGDVNNKFRLYVMRPDGSNVLQLTNPPPGADDVRPAWAENGRAILFNRDANGDSRVMQIEFRPKLARRW